MRTAVILIILVPSMVFAQSKTMRDLDEKYPDAFVLVFYHSSLNMLNIDDDPDFARLIRDINKIKLLRFDLKESGFNSEELSQLKSTLKARKYEELMIVKGKGYNTTVYILEKGGDIEGYFMYIQDHESFTAIDVDGTIQVGDISMLVDKIKDVEKIN